MHNYKDHCEISSNTYKGKFSIVCEVNALVEEWMYVISFFHAIIFDTLQSLQSEFQAGDGEARIYNLCMLFLFRLSR